MSSVVSGVISVIEPTKTYGSKGFCKRLLVLEQEGDRFTNYVPIDIVRDLCDNADELMVGDAIDVNYELKGRAWQKDEQSEVKYFLNAEAVSWRVTCPVIPPEDLKDDGKKAATVTKEASPDYDDGDIPF